jgi:hypothetical protein
MLAAPFIGRGAVSLWAGAVLIDADHYVWFCLRQRHLSIPAAVRFFNQADVPQHSATRVLHAPAVLLSVLLLAMRQRRLLPVAVGMGMHIALDAHHLARMDLARSAALARDEYSCQACGTAAQPVGTHVWRQPRLLPSYRSQNLISLCSRCHEAAHARSREPMPWT